MQARIDQIDLTSESWRDPNSRMSMIITVTKSKECLTAEQLFSILCQNSLELEEHGEPDTAQQWHKIHPHIDARLISKRSAIPHKPTETAIEFREHNPPDTKSNNKPVLLDVLPILVSYGALSIKTAQQHRVENHPVMRARMRSAKDNMTLNRASDKKLYEEIFSEFDLKV